MLALHSKTAIAEASSLEKSADAARDCFACMFSTSDEYENDLIRERREAGHYRHRLGRESAIFASCIAVLAAVFFAAF